MKDIKGRTIVSKPTISKANARKLSSSVQLIEDARAIIDNEMQKIAAQSFGSGAPLGPDETRALHGHTKAIETLLKTEIEDNKVEGGMGDTDMMTLFVEALKMLQIEHPGKSAQELLEIATAKVRQGL